MAAHTSANFRLQPCNVTGQSATRSSVRLPQRAVRCRTAGSARRVQRITAAATLGGDQDSQNRAAEQRWKNQLTDGRVKNVSAATAGELLSDGWTLLDVRPPHEIAKAGIKGAVEVPIFVVEESNDPSSLLKKASALAMGGLWLGGTHMKPNPNFGRDVQAKIPKDARIIVTCQKGLRSLAAAEQLSRAGYSTLAWINGGLDTSRKGDLPAVRDVDLRYGGIGGLTEVLGLTEVQRDENPSSKDRGNLFIKVAAAVLLADFGLFVWEYVQAMQNGTTPPVAPL